MSDINPLIAFGFTALVIEITPGPNMTYLAALSLSSGTRAGFAAVAGIALGLMTYGLIAAWGLAAMAGAHDFYHRRRHRYSRWLPGAQMGRAHDFRAHARSHR